MPSRAATISVGRGSPVAESADAPSWVATRPCGFKSRQGLRDPSPSRVPVPPTPVNPAAVQSRAVLLGIEANAEVAAEPAPESYVSTSEPVVESFDPCHPLAYPSVPSTIKGHQEKVNDPATFRQVNFPAVWGDKDGKPWSFHGFTTPSPSGSKTLRALGRRAAAPPTSPAPGTPTSPS